MAELARTGVSIDGDLLLEFDRLIAKRGYKNRSEAFRDLIRDALLTETVDSNKPVVGTLTLVYDHHVPNLSEKLTGAQHSAGAMILAATHVHLDHHYCLEVVIMKGKSWENLF
jgi:CopG family nickel-responsive transcriptional regulator